MTAPQDDPTSRFYSDNAEVYASHLLQPNSTRLDRFLSRLPAGAAILELGCGNGRDSAAMIARGFSATPTDGTPEMAGEASRRLGMPVPVLRFENIDLVSAFDGIWANACLLHVRRAELGGILRRIHTALRPGGIFYASFKAGQAEGHDALGRFFNYPSTHWLQALYETMPWQSVVVEEEIGSGYDRIPTAWLHVTTAKA
jgi:SAM-dependent methyltransferase